MMVSLLLILFTSFICVHSKGPSTGEQLITHILRNTYKASVPQLATNESVAVTFGIQLVQVIELHDSSQLLTAKYWVRQSWYNELMRWNTSEWDGIKQVSVDSKLVWTPDIVLYNNGGKNKIETVKIMKGFVLHIFYFSAYKLVYFTFQYFKDPAENIADESKSL